MHMAARSDKYVSLRARKKNVCEHMDAPFNSNQSRSLLKHVERGSCVLWHHYLAVFRDADACHARARRHRRMARIYRNTEERSAIYIYTTGFVFIEDTRVHTRYIICISMYKRENIFILPSCLHIRLFASLLSTPLSLVLSLYQVRDRRALCERICVYSCVRLLLVCLRVY